mmetsp:Transcript_26913/g.41019  ORF Transcript_26913/g.41019 Transcript_26913/m.41019 type:complete len:112 (-) Transcript_26913:158-493(-)
MRSELSSARKRPSSRMLSNKFDIPSNFDFNSDYRLSDRRIAPILPNNDGVLLDPRDSDLSSFKTYRDDSDREGSGVSPLTPLEASSRDAPREARLMSDELDRQLLEFRLKQ